MTSKPGVFSMRPLSATRCVLESSTTSTLIIARDSSEQVSCQTMKTFAVITTYVPDAEERRKPYREAHLAYNRELKARGKVVSAGALVDPLDSALLVYKVESRAEAFAQLAKDPYAQNGIWQEVSVREW